MPGGRTFTLQLTRHPGHNYFIRNNKWNVLFYKAIIETKNKRFNLIDNQHLNATLITNPSNKKRPKPVVSGVFLSNLITIRNS
jgi:hypothetical protein